MKYIYTIFTIAALAVVVGALYPRTGHSSSLGAVEGSAGVPGEGTCAQPACHGTPGASTPATLVSTDIPAGGYVPGTQYNITVSHTQAGISRFGFQAAVRFMNNNKAGSLSSGAGSQLLSGGSYITHTSSGTSGSGSKSWTFKWTAPATGSGPVTFYTALLAANNNGTNDQDDQVYSDSKTVSESGHNGIATFADAGMALYPAPFTNELTIDCGQHHSGSANVKIYTIDGKLAKATAISGGLSIVSTTDLAAGVYIVHLTTDSGLAVMQKAVKF